jgi:sorting nexin-29
METQNGFRSGRSCTDPIFSLKLPLEKRRVFNLETHFLFLEYEKAFDQVNRLKLFNILQKRNIPDPLFTEILKIYEHKK